MLSPLLATIRKNTAKPFIIAIDGRCCAGKTTLAAKLCTLFDAALVHMDHFYLPKEAQNPLVPGGNIDFERLKNEVLLPLRDKKDYLYREFDCASQTYLEPVLKRAKNIVILEGTYSTHKQLFSLSHYKIFLDISKKEQKRRLLAREGAQRAKEMNKWLIAEEKYFLEYLVRKKSDKVFFNPKKVFKKRLTT